MRWGKTPQVGETRERLLYLWKPRRFYRRSSSFYFEDNGESIVLWLEKVYVVERWSYCNDQNAAGGMLWIGGERRTNHSKCHWRVEAWRLAR